MTRLLWALLATLLILVPAPVETRRQAAVQVFKGTFTGATGTGNQTVSGITDQHGSAFTPKLVLIWGSQQTSAATTDSVLWNLGVTDCTNQRTSWAGSEDNAASSNANQSVHNARLLDTYSTAVANQSRGTISSCGSGQFVINWSVAAAGTDFIYHYVAIGGSSFTTLLQTLIADATPSADASTFIAKGLWLFPTGVTANGTNAQTTNLGVGWVAKQDAGTYQQSMAWGCSEDNSAAADTYRWQVTTSAYSQPAGACSTNALDYQYQGNYGLLPVTQNNEWAWSITMAGLQVKAGVGLQPTTTGTQAITGVGFAPLIAFFWSFGQTAQTTIQTENRVSFGACTAAAQGQIWLGDLDAADPTVTARMTNTTTVITSGTPDATGSSSTVQAQADCDALGSDGVTLDWTTADATQRQYVWYMMGLPSSTTGERSYVF